MKQRIHPRIVVLLAVLFLMLLGSSAVCEGPATDAAGHLVSHMAAEISADAGAIGEVTNAAKNRVVVVFKERHDSRIGQVEIALMLVRLHRAYGMDHISLEGAIAADGPLPAEWYHRLTDSSHASWQRGAEVALQLLKTGEISAAEFVSLTLPNVTVRGSEKQDEYDVELDDEAASSPVVYLLAIAQESLSQDTIRKANQLIVGGKQEEALDLILRSDRWTEQRYEKLSNKVSTPSTSEMSALLREIEKRAKEVGAQVSSQDGSNLRRAIRFFDVATQRSETMVRNTLAMVSQTGSRPVGMIIGAAHTDEIVRLLGDSDGSFAAIAPKSLMDPDGDHDLDTEAYHRKLELRSVDGANGLGAILDGRRKPPTVLREQWLRSKASILLAANLIAEAAGGGQKPPFIALGDELDDFDSIRIDPESYELMEKNGVARVMFKVTGRVDDEDANRTVDLWVGAWAENNDLEIPEMDETMDEDGKRSLTLERLVEEALHQMRESDPPSNNIALLPISKRTTATFSPSSAAVRATMKAG